MSDLFRNVLNASFQGGIVIAVVLLARLALKKAPKKYACLLWILVGVRLLCPFTLESRLSLQPDVPQVIQTYTQEQPQPEITMQEMVPAVPDDAELPEDVEIVYGDAFKENISGTVEPEQHRVVDWVSICASIWLIGAGLLTVYSLVSYLLLKRRVREAVHLFGNVWECDGIGTAFILGFRQPKILIPMGLNPKSRLFILEHERTHLEKRDHWVKLIGFIALSVHWFNPLVWLAYVLLCRDMELACDERVIRDMGLEDRKRYSAALLECSVNRAHWAACPVAFGEVSVKQRILSVLNYRKSAFWVSIIAVIAIIFVAVCFLTDPAGEARIPSGNGDWEDEVRAVLEEVQSRDSYAIIEQRRFEGEKALNDSADINFFRSGDDWLTISYIDDLDRGGWTGHLYLDGTYYEAISDEAVFDWQPTEMTDFPEPWLYSFDMDAVEADAISRKVTDEGYELRLLVQGPLYDSGDSYYVDFSFDHDGNFRNAVLHISHMDELMGEMVETTITTTMSLIDIPEEDIRSTIDVYAETLDSDMETIWSSDSVQNETQPDWGMTLTAVDVSSSRLTLVCERKGGEWPGYVMTGRYWWVEKWTGSQWEVLDAKEGLAWPMDAQILGPDATARWSCSFEWVYGGLEPGRYRIGKNFNNVAEYKVGVPQSAEEITCAYYAEFVIEETDPLARCEAALKAFQAQESQCVMTAWQSTLYGNTESFYSNGEDWLLQGLENTEGYWYLEKDGGQYARTVENVPESEGDSGWAETQLKDEDSFKPWISTFDWDAAQIEFVEAVNGDDWDTVTFLVQGSPCDYRDTRADVASYTVRFCFYPGTGRLKYVDLSYTMTRSGGETLDVMKSLTLDTGEDVQTVINRVYDQEIAK